MSWASYRASMCLREFLICEREIRIISLLTFLVGSEQVHACKELGGGLWASRSMAHALVDGVVTRTEDARESLGVRGWHWEAFALIRTA